MGRPYIIALAGNPNCGKTTIFNLLTGAHQHVGNYPGVTVERKKGRCRIGNCDCTFIDLPGIYGLSNSSPEEKVAFDELYYGKIDLILNVVDAGNAQRNLYLTTQIAELGLPMLIAFNMIDDAKARGLSFNFPLLERFFGAKIIPTVGADGIGIDALKQAIGQALLAPPAPPQPIRYGKTLDSIAVELSESTAAALGLPPNGKCRALALKLLENPSFLQQFPKLNVLAPRLQELRAMLQSRYGTTAEGYLADRRYGAIAGACRETISSTAEKRRQISEVIDKVVLNRFLGIPIFLAVMYLMFTFTFYAAAPLTEGLQWIFSTLVSGIDVLWPDQRWELLHRLLSEGVIGGVGGVLAFLPNLLLLFLAIAFLEGTGYMSRAAFVMDGFMHLFGLHGKSFVPMVLGFGCSVPAVMATRTIESRKDRLTTMMVLPFFSCSARLPIYALMIPAFFAEQYRALILLVLYSIGFIVALAAARVLKSTLFSGEDEIFLMELPPYRLPTLRSMSIHIWERTVLYLKKAGTMILFASIVMFLLNTYPIKPAGNAYSREKAKVEQSTLSQEEKAAALDKLNFSLQAERLEYSCAGRIGKAIAVVMRPAGFDWRASSALVGAAVGKELFVAQLSILYRIGDADSDSGRDVLQSTLHAHYTPLQGFCIMLFCLLTFPCIATLAVIRKESGSWGIMLLEFFGMTSIAYCLTVAVYQCGLFFLNF